ELKRVLVVEDDPDIRAVVQLTLETVGQFDVCICASGAEALAQAEAFSPQLIMLDVMMPEMDGPTTLKKLREKLPDLDVPVAFMTAKVQPQELQVYRELGVVDIVAKPFDPMTLPDRIREIWADKRSTGVSDD
ncbi:MAG: response regulator, partial [Proteobacteria bacterium]